jgi:GMP synthase PP-ATPase subunit
LWNWQKRTVKIKRLVSIQKIKEIQDRLLKELTGLDRLLISYSGGVDSTLLAIFAQKALHDRSSCILFDAPIVPRRAIEDAAEIARNKVKRFIDFVGKPLTDHIIIKVTGSLTNEDIFLTVVRCQSPRTLLIRSQNSIR